MATPPNGNNNCKTDGKSSCPSACSSGQPQPPPALGKSMIDLVGWDAEMAALAAKSPASNAGIPSATVNSSAAAYEKLHEQMAHAAKESPENVEILSRLAQATYSLGLNQTDPAAVKGKTAEALALAEKVVAMDANNFRGHLWQAMAAGKLALLGCTVQEKIKYTVTFLRALAVCIRLSPKDPMVLFMEGRFQLALSSLTEEEKAAIKAHLPHLPPTVNWAEAEAKLRESIAANAAFLDGYLTLAYLLIKAKKYVEAKEVILKGLQQMVTTKSDEQMAAEMKTLQVRINSLVPQ